MSEFPSMPLFTDAFIADTGHLNAQESGAYLLLLMVAWRTPGCRLPDDDTRLARWARVDLRTWRKIKPKVMEFWKLHDGSWSQKRQLKERDFVSKRAAVARRNGQQGGKSKPLEPKEMDSPAGSSRDTQTEAPNPNPSISSSPQARERGDLENLESRLRQAAGWENHPAPRLFELAPILGLIDAGFSLDDEILPVVHARAPRVKRPSGWGYFVPIIHEQREQRLAAKNFQTGGDNGTAHQHPNGRTHPGGPKRTNSDLLMAGMAKALSRNPRSRLYDCGREGAPRAASGADDPPQVLAIAGPAPGSGTPH